MNGFLVSGQDATALAKAVKILLEDTDERTRFGRAARERVERDFNVVETAGQLRELIQSR